MKRDIALVGMNGLNEISTLLKKRFLEFEISGGCGGLKEKGGGGTDDGGGCRGSY